MLLWEHLKSRMREVNNDQTNAVGGMGYDQVRDRTSAEIDSVGTGSIFDETIKFYTKRKDHAQAFLVDALAESHQTAFRPYLAKAQWSIVNTDSDLPQMSITAELDEPLRVSYPSLCVLTVG